MLIAVVTSGRNLRAEQDPSPTDYQVIDEIRIEADGDKEHTYDLIRKNLGHGSIEAPDIYKKNHRDVKHIQQRDGSPYGPYFVFTIHREEDRDRGLYPKNSDRQRNEIKAYDKSAPATQGRKGETVRYHWYFRPAKDFPVTKSFSHFMQIKAYDQHGGGMPLLTISGYLRRGAEQLEVRYTKSESGDSVLLAKSPWNLARGHWLEVEVIATYSDRGYLRVTICDQMGKERIQLEKHNIDLWRKGVEFNRPKWGIYRSLRSRHQLVNEVDRMDFADFTIQKIKWHAKTAR